LTLDRQTLREVLDSIAAKSPTPGGGAVASIACSLGASLAEMVLNYSVGRKSLAAHDQLHRDALKAMMELRFRALDLAQADAAAYAAMNAVWKLDASDPRRRAELPAAAEQAIQPPAQIAQCGLEILRILANLTGKTNVALNSDLAIAAILADAAVRAAMWNVEINLPLLTDETKLAAWLRTISESLAESQKLCAAVEQQCRGT